MGWLKKGEKYIKKAYELNPNNKIIIENLSDFHFDQREFD